ncbi:MAG: sulfite exporter TauE/SafE family protein [Beijerinckiaceae bacterium]
MLSSLIHQSGFADVASFLTLALAAALGGLVRGFTGFGFAMVFMPIATVVVGPVAAAGIIFLIDAPFAFPLAAPALRKAEWREVIPLFIGAVFAMPVGVYLLTTTDPAVVRWALAMLVMGGALTLASGWRYRGHAGTPLSVGVGGVSGLFSGLAQLGGMPLAIFWLGAARNDARQVKDNLNAYFALTTVLGAFLLWRGGVLTAENGLRALALMPVYGAALWIGLRSFHLASEATFRRIAFGIILGAAVVALPVVDVLIGR